MKRRRAWMIGLILAGVGLAVAASETVVEVVDQTGNTVRIPQPVERVVSVYGMGSYYVYTLGASDRLAKAWYVGVKGISQASDAMLRLEPRLEKILAFGDPNVEEMVALGTGLILVDGSRHAAFAEQMLDLGVPVLQFLVETPEALKEAVLLTGAALGVDAFRRAEAFIADYERILSAVAGDLAALSDTKGARVLFLGTDPLTVASGAMYQTHLIEAAGGVSVTSDLPGYWNEVGLEQVLLWTPDVIIIPPYGELQPVDLLTNPDWSALAAVQAGRVHRMPRIIAPMDAPVPESLLGVAWLADVLHPGVLTLDLGAEAEAFYAEYYGYVLSDEERGLFGRR